MPEGPEVTIVTDNISNFLFRQNLMGFQVISGRYKETGILGTNLLPIHKSLPILDVDNKGKFIWIEFEDEIYLFCTLGMTGGFKVKENKYTRVAFYFNNSEPLFYCDMRNFGTLKFVKGRSELEKKLKSIGPDMLNNPPSFEEFLVICDKRKTNSLVKFLMEQKNISGVGNIYKSESLYQAKLLPWKTVGDCSVEELFRLYVSIIGTLKNAYDLGGASIRDYSDIYNVEGKFTRFPSQPNEMLEARKFTNSVYGRKTDLYNRKVEKIVLDDARTTYYVPEVQK